MAQQAVPPIAALKVEFPNFFLHSQQLFIEHTEVSNQMWWDYYKAVATTSPSKKKALLPDNGVWKRTLPYHDPNLAKYFGKKSFLNFPVVGITYEQAIAYCQWRSEAMTEEFEQQQQATFWNNYEVTFTFRLPTEEEWQTQAKSLLHGRNISALEATIHCRKGAVSSRNLKIAEQVQMQQVGDKNLFHFFGNVSEMTSTKGVAKGGNWLKTIEYCAPDQQNLYRVANAWLGFRCVMEVNIQAKKQFNSDYFKQPIAYSNWLDTTLRTRDTTNYHPTPNAVVIAFNYESEVLIDTMLSSRLEDEIVTDIEIVFTRYPYKLSEWSINYHQLFAQRVQRLLHNYPNLNQQSIRWRIIRQTDARTKAEAEALFHGFVIHTSVPKAFIFDPTPIPKVTYEDETVRNYSIALDTFDLKKPEEEVIKDFFEQHPDKVNHALVVMDWTASMYPYACETILLNLQASETVKARYFSFFNDGDQLKNWHKEIGKTGGIYFAYATEMDDVLRTMKKAQEAGNGGDIPENDAEAVLTAIQHYPNAEQVVLVADNQSSMRDTTLIPQIKRPIHIILCGMEYQFYGRTVHVLNKQYYDMMQETDGSLYFQDYEQYKDRLNDSLPSLMINGATYWVLDEDFVLEGQENFNFVFRGKTIEVVHIKQEQQEEASKFIEFNEQNFPTLIQLNQLIHEKKNKFSKKKKQ